MTNLESRSGREENGGSGGQARLAIIAAALVVVLGSGGVAWFAYNKGFYRASDQLAPLVRAETGETKRRPEQPGGLEIPDQDKLVFDRLAPGQSEQRVERLLPPPEEPLAKPEPPVVDIAKSVPEEPATPAEVSGAILDALAQNAPEVAPAPEEVAQSGPVIQPEKVADAPPEVPATTTESLLAEAAPPPPPEAPQIATAPELPKTESLLAPPAPQPPASEPQQAAAPAVEAPQIAAKPDHEPEPAPEILPAAISGWRIQLASLSSSDGAKSEWKRLQGRNEALLGNLQLSVQKAELSRGTFYRIQAGPLANKAAAQQLCADLKERKQDCLVVKP